jgi:MFS family permease
MNAIATPMPAAPPQAARHPREALLLATVFFLNLIEFLQNGMIALAAGPIMGETSASPEEYTIVTATYAVVAIAAIARLGWLVERLGWRRYVQASVAVFILGALICGHSGSFVQFLVGRAIMGLGGAAFMTSGRLLIQQMPPSPRRFLGIKVFASALTIGNAAGPWLASILVANGHWQHIFVLLAALGLVAAALAQLVLPTSVAPEDTRSVASPLLVPALMAGCFASLYALQRANYDFFAGAWPLLLALVAGASVLALLARHQVAQPRPLLAIKTLLQARYLSGVAVFTVCYVVLGANGYMLPMLMQRGLGFSWEVIGQVQGSGLIVALPVFWFIAAFIPTRPSPKKYYLAGFLSLALCGALLWRITPEAGLWTEVMPAIGAYGAFIIIIMAITALHGFSELQRDEKAFNNGQQLKNMLSQFGSAFGTAAAALSLQWRSSEHLAALGTRFSNGDASFAQAAGQLGEHFAASHGAQAGQVALATLAQQMTQQASLLASLDYFGFLAAAALLMAGVMMVQKVLK